jgi:hypothetical protein
VLPALPFTQVAQVCVNPAFFTGLINLEPCLLMRESPKGNRMSMARTPQAQQDRRATAPKWLNDLVTGAKSQDDFLIRQDTLQTA